MPLFLFFLLPLIYFFPRIMTNQNARYALVFSLVEDKSLAIDRFVRTTSRENLLDKAVYQGHYFSDKPPLPALLAAVSYALLSFIYHPAPTQAAYFTLATILRILVISIPAALFALFLFSLARRKTPPLLAYFLTTGFFFGTLFFPYATLFYGHVLAAIFLFLGFQALFRKQLFLSGLFVGLAFASDFLSALFLPIALLFLQKRRSFLHLIAGFCLGSFVVWAYNTICFGAPWRFAYSFEVESGFHTAHARGFFGIGVPKMATLVKLLFGGRGLFFLSPFLLFSVGALFLLPRLKPFREALFALLLFSLFLLINAGYYMPFGGWSLGPRFLIPSLPFLFYLLLYLPPFYQWSAVLLSLWGVGLMTAAVAVTPLVPDTVAYPFAHYLLPKFSHFELGQNIGTIFHLQGAFSLLPILILEGMLFGWNCHNLGLKRS